MFNRVVKIIGTAQGPYRSDAENIRPEKSKCSGHPRGISALYGLGYLAWHVGSTEFLDAPFPGCKREITDSRKLFSNDYCTVKIAFAFTPSNDAVIVLVPEDRPLAMPCELTVAVLTLEDFQFASRETLAVEPSLNLPVAVNCRELPTLTDALDGVTASEVKVPLVTVNDAVPTWPLKTAVILAEPGCRPVASPLVPKALLMVAIVGGDDVHVTAVVRF